MPEPLFREVKAVIRAAKGGEWEPMMVEDAASYLLTDSRAYHDTGDKVGTIHAHMEGTEAVEMALTDAGLRPAWQELDYSKVTPGRESFVNTMLHVALEDCGMSDPKTRVYSTAIVAPMSDEEPDGRDMLVVADVGAVEWDKLNKRVDFYERALKDKGVFTPVKYAGEDYVTVSEDRPALETLLPLLLTDVSRVDAWKTPDGEVVPRESRRQQVRELTDHRRDLLERMSDAPSEEMFSLAAEYFGSRLRNDNALRPEGAEAATLYPKQEVVKAMQSLGIEIAEIRLA